MSVYEIIFLSIIALILILSIVDHFTKRSITRKIFQWRPALAAATALASAVAKVLPSEKFSVAATVLQAASDATQRAELLYKEALLEKNDRNEYAQQMIKYALNAAGIEITEQVQQMIDGAIATVCMLIPHGIVVNEMIEEELN